MTWFKVDDSLAFHRKTVAAGNPAMGLWVRAGSWSAQQLTDGFVPIDLARRLGTQGQAERLISAGFWLPSADGYDFHEWNGRNPSREQVQARRDAGAERLRKWRESNGRAPP